MGTNGTEIEVVTSDRPALTIIAPKSLREAGEFANMAFRSGFLPKTVDSPEKATMILLKGLELGLTPMQSFAGLNVIQGKVESSAELMIALCLRSPACQYFTLIESSSESATWETHRHGAPGPVRRTFSYEDARAMGLTDKDNYKKQGKTMLEWRAASALAKKVYPDLVLGMYVTGETEVSEPVSYHSRTTPTITRDVVDMIRDEPIAPAVLSEHTDDELIEEWTMQFSEAQNKAAVENLKKEFKQATNSKWLTDKVADLYRAATKRVSQ